MSHYRLRRSVKPFAMDPSRPISKDIVTSILEDAIWAPSHKLNQPWRFHAFITPIARERLAQELCNIYDAITPELRRDEEKKNKLPNAIRHVPVAIAVAAKLESGLPEWEEVAATGCAVQNLMLSAYDKGVASFWATPPISCSPDFARTLGMDASHRPMGFILLGYPKSSTPDEIPTRLPLDCRVTWHEE